MGKMLVYRRISFKDLEDAGFNIYVSQVGDKLEWSGVETLKLMKALYFLGVKNSQHLEVQDKCEHLRLSGTRVKGYSFVGEERNDKAWLASGYASEEAKISSSRMGDMLETVNRLKRGGGV